MRVVFSVFIALFAGQATAQVWEKMVAPGLSYRMEVDRQTPRIIHGLRWSFGAQGLSAKPEFAYQRALSANPDGGRQTLPALIDQAGAIAGVNGDFFPPLADPLGLMVRDGELVSQPWPKRAAFAWGPGGSMAGVFAWSGRVQPATGGALTLNGVNQECGDNELVLVTDDAGQVVAKPPSLVLRIQVGDVVWRPGADVTATVAAAITDAPITPVAPGEAYLVARGTAAGSLTGLAAGTTLTIRLDVIGLDFSKHDQVAGGGPMLLQAGKPAIDWDSAGFSQGFANNRHPRTAVGRTRSGDLWFVVIDGRQPMSAGANLSETAQIMLDLGCVDAINLDGGGSSTLAILGVTLNRPSDGQERKVANGILLFGPAPADAPSEAVIQGPARVQLGGEAAYAVIGPDGKPMPTRDVLWSAMGAAWIDQGGTLRAIREGPATIRASVRGRITALNVLIIPRATP